LLFLYRQVLNQELKASIQAVRARRPQRLPTVLSREEAGRIIDALEEPEKLVIQILYGCGLRVKEGLRVKDVDFELNQIVVHDGKGQKSRRTMLPTKIRLSLQAPWWVRLAESPSIFQPSSPRRRAR
jgi:integrase